MQVGDVIPRDKVADLSSHRPKPGEEAMLVTDDGLFWGKAQEDGSFLLERQI